MFNVINNSIFRWGMLQWSKLMLKCHMCVKDCRFYWRYLRNFTEKLFSDQFNSNSNTLY